MTGFMKKIKAFLGKPYLSIVFIALTIIVVWAVGSTNVRYQFGDMGPSTCDSPAALGYLAVSESGAYAYLEDSDFNHYLRVVDAQGNADMFFDAEEDIIPVSMCYDEKDNLYVHCNVYYKAQDVISKDRIVRIASGSHDIETVYEIDYETVENQPTRDGRIKDITYKDGLLYFAYVDEEKTELVSFDVSNYERKVINTYDANEDGSFICKVWPSDEGFVFLLTDGRMYSSDGTGELGEPIYTFDTSLDSVEERMIPYAATIFRGKVYASLYRASSVLYSIEEGQMEEVLDIADYIDDQAPEDVMINNISSDENVLSIVTMDRAFTYDGTDVESLATSYPIGFERWLGALLPYLHVALYILSAISLILMCIFLKKTILSKQLMVLIPTVLLLIISIYLFQSRTLLMVYEYSLKDEIVSVSEMLSQNLDVDKLSGVDSLSDIDQEYLTDLRENLLDQCRRNRSTWSGKYDFIVAKPAADDYYSIVTTTNLTVPFEGKIHFALDSFTLKSENESGVSLYDSQNDKAGFVAMTPLYDSNGEEAATLFVCTNMYTTNQAVAEAKRMLWYIMMPIAILMVLIMTILANRMTKAIRRASVTVSKLAEGDLSARIKEKSDDEIGDICRQVNSMAESLGQLFEENKKKEDFYYKFVPEKFRELLGKEKITDLSLGDAESREFTVLFCDIRSFSLNSEMLTAKENFEFVNVVYGIAGPIVRKYGGFIDKYIGDAVMALFESAESAILAGEEIYRQIVLDPTTAEQLHVSYIKVGVGIHTGIARIGIVGEEERLSGTVISNSVNISSRLESLTKTYQTAMIITKETLDKIGSPENMNLRYLGMVQVAGVNEVKSLYEVLDCLPDEQRELRNANKDDFREAVRLFHLGDREGSINVFEKMQATGMADSTANMYLEYIKNLSPEDKTKVFRFDKK